ncbi:MAG TPA: ROK family protein [Gaiellaceae bacterium]|nr:ROK family protein [Gaiellaceae bacterium]
MTTPEAQDGATQVIGVDVGGTKVLAAVVSHDGSLGARIERTTDVSSEQAHLAMLDGMVEELRAGDPDVAALGFGLPSRIDQRRGRAVASVNVPLTDVDFRDRMRERHGLPVGIDNDANAAAIAEWRGGAARGAQDVVMLTLGTGVGGGLILGGAPYRGATGSGAELGHVVVELDGLPCRCGGRGHLESFATGLAADRVARERIGAESDAHDLVRRGRAGEPEAVDALAGIGRYVGAAIASFVNALEPELIVIGGGFGEAAGDLLLGSAREVLARDGLSPGRESVRIVEAQLGTDAGVIGAGMLAFEALGAEA